jgi:hypothetical protein
MKTVLCMALLSIFTQNAFAAETLTEFNTAGPSGPTPGPFPPNNNANPYDYSFPDWGGTSITGLSVDNQLLYATEGVSATNQTIEWATINSNGTLMNGPANTLTPFGSNQDLSTIFTGAIGGFRGIAFWPGAAKHLFLIDNTLQVFSATVTYAVNGSPLFAADNAGAVIFTATNLPGAPTPNNPPLAVRGNKLYIGGGDAGWLQRYNVVDGAPPVISFDGYVIASFLQALGVPSGNPGTPLLPYSLAFAAGNLWVGGSASAGAIAEFIDEDPDEPLNPPNPHGSAPVPFTISGVATKGAVCGFPLSGNNILNSDNSWPLYSFAAGGAQAVFNGVIPFADFCMNTGLAAYDGNLYQGDINQYFIEGLDT